MSRPTVTIECVKVDVSGRKLGQYVDIVLHGSPCCLDAEVDDVILVSRFSGETHRLQVERICIS